LEETFPRQIKENLFFVKYTPFPDPIDSINARAASIFGASGLEDAKFAITEDD